MHDRVRRAADCRDHAEGVPEGFRRQDPGRPEILPHDVNRAAPGGVGEFQEPAVSGRDSAAARQRHAQGLRDACHGGRGTHRVAVTAAADHRGLGVPHLRRRAPSGVHLVAKPVQAGPAAQPRSPPPAVEHRPARDQHRGQVDRGCPEQQRGDRLVAAAQQHRAVDRIGAQQFLDHQGAEIAVHHRGRAHERLAQGRDRDLQGNPARLPDAPLHMVRHFPQVRVAGCQVRPRIADRDMRTVSAEGVVGEPATHPCPVGRAVQSLRAVPGLGTQFRHGSLRLLSSGHPTVRARSAYRPDASNFCNAG